MFDWIGKAFGGLFGKNDDEEKKKRQQQQAPKPTPSAPGQQIIPMGQPTQQTLKPAAPKQPLNEPLKVASPGSTNSMVLASTPRPVTVGDAPKMLKPEVQQEWADERNRRAGVQAPTAPKLAQPKPVVKTPSAGETAVDFIKNYINPLGEHGVFGKATISERSKGIENLNKDISGWIDKNIDPSSANGKFDSIGDVARFAAKLPSGMAEGFVTAPRDLREAVTGKRLDVDNNGRVTGEKDINGLQRTGAAANAIINTLGLGVGGSATLLKSVVGKGSQEIAKGALNQGARNTAKQVVKEVAKDSVKEGVEEGVQSFATDLQDQGRFDEGSLARAGESALLGAAGGSIMSGAGKANVAAQRYVSNKLPTTATERADAIKNGIVTPETKHLTVEERVQTALNSDIGRQVRTTVNNATERVADAQRAVVDAPTNLRMRAGDLATDARAGVGNAITDARSRVQTPNMPDFESIGENISEAPSNIRDYMGGVVDDITDRVGGMRESIGDRIQGAVDGVRDRFGRQDPVDENYRSPYNPYTDDGVDYRLGQPSDTSIDRATMQQIQMDNNHMFGTDAPNVDFVPGSMLTPDGRTALGKTVDTFDGPSQISISKEQGDARATNLHEAVHKALNDYMTQEERSAVIASYAVDNSVSGRTERDTEEMVAEDFIQYVANRNNKDIPAPTVRQRVSEIFERVFKRLQLVTAKMMRNNTMTPEYQQFYNDLYSGEFANKQLVDKSDRSVSPERDALIEHRNVLQQRFDQATDNTARQQINQALANIDAQIRSLARTPQGDTRYSLAGEKATGFEDAQKNGRVFDGIDGKPRFELSDERMAPKGEFSSTGEATVGDLIAHDDLFRNYPGLKDMTVTIDPNLKANASIDSRSGNITVGPRMVDEVTRMPDNPNITMSKIRSYFKDLGYTNEQLRELDGLKVEDVLKSFNEDTKARIAGGTDVVQRLNDKGVSSLLHELQHEIQDYEGFNSGTSPERAGSYDNYFKNAGEAEARAVANRRTMTDAERYVPRTADEYAMSHRPDAEGAPAHNLAEEGFVPNDVYTNPEWYGSVSDKATRESLAVLQKIRGNPDAEVMVYRAAPRNELNDGDWISLSREYANGESLAEGTSVHSFKVKAKDLKWPGDSFNEFGYFPETKPVRSTFYDSLDVPKEDLTVSDNNQGKFSMSIEQNKPAMTRSMRNAIETVIHDRYKKHRDAALYADAGVDVNTIDIGHGPGVIPRLPVKDLEHHFGKAVAAGIPSRYKTRDKTNAGGADQIALETDGNRYSGDINNNEYMDNWLNAIEKRSMSRQDLAELRELRKDPKIIQEAMQRIEEVKADIDSSMKIRDKALKEGDFDTVKDAEDSIAELEGSYGMKPSERHTPESAAIYKEKYDKRLAKFDEFANSKEDAKKLADLAPTVASVEEINSKTRKLKLAGGDSMVKVDVKGKDSKPLEFAVRNTIDQTTSKSTIDLVPLDGEQHTLKNGMVVDKNGKSVGSYVKIDENGEQIAYVEGKPVNITHILGDIEQWGNLHKASWDMDRLIELNAPDKDTARNVQKFLTQFKDQQESMMKTELLQRRTELETHRQAALKNLPKGISKKELSEDMFRITEKKADYAEMVKKYGQDYMDNYIKPAVVWWRKTADDTLNATNQTLEQNGYDPIPRLDNYISHIQADPSWWEKVGIGIRDINPMGSSISSDINPGKTRGGVPEEIVGNTSNTGARRKWNPFAQARRGSQHEQDFFKAIDSYFEPMLFNKYMTPAASRTRVVERTFRTFEKAKEMQETERLDELTKEFGLTTAQKMVNDEKTTRNHSKYKKDRRSPMITAWQEYGNILAGKTNSIDRGVIDRLGSGGEKLMTANTKAQGIVGRSSIPGSASAALAQVLSIPQTIGRDSYKSFAKATKQMLMFDGKRAGSNDPLLKSAFMKARYTDASSKQKGILRKYSDKASTPMEMIERATGELSWRSAYNEALSKGLEGKEAILQADLETKKTLAGRGIGDRPMIMNSKALGIFTQFGLEVNNTRIQYWKDFTPQQKIKFTVAAFGLNSAMGAVTGNSYLPDYLGALFDTMADAENGEDDKKDTPMDNAKQAAQRVLGETSKFIPGAAAVAGVFMDDKTKEKVFGKNMDLSRYGTPAASRAADPLIKLWNGDFGGAAASAGSLMPTGSQVKRSAGGVSALEKGYTENSKGNVQNVYDNKDPWTQFKTAVFGRNAIPGQPEAMNSGRALDKTQSEVFRELYKTDPNAAKEYFNEAMGIKVQKSDKKGTPTDVGYKPDSAGALSSQAAAAAAEANVKIKEGLTKGDIVQKNGIYYTKSGAVKTDYYKTLAQSSSGKSDDAYKAYLLGYGLAKGTKYDPDTGKNSKSGDATVDKLENLKDKAGTSGSVLSNAMSLFKGDKSDVPDWVEDKFYKDAGWSKEQVGYAVQASYNTEQKMEGLYRPLAQQEDRQAFMDALVQGRAKSIASTKSANDAVISALYKEGYLSKEEQKYLKSLTVDKDGTQRVSTSSSSGGGKRGRKGKSGSGVTKSDISSYLDATGQSGSDTASLIKKYGSISMGSSGVRANTPRMRSMRVAGKKSTSRRKL